MEKKIKNIERAAEIIKEAVKNKERIILYGDSDMDGISSVLILEETIKNLGGEVLKVMFPDRELDGYGLNFKALEIIHSLSPALLVTLDLGIANVKEIKKANELGFRVIVIDHHEPLHALPEAEVVVDPDQKDDEYPFKELCNTGIVFKLSEEMLGSNMSYELRKSFLEIVALATIADMVPQVEENKIYIEEGLRSLGNTFRPGLIAFMDILGKGEVLSGGYLKLISALNAAESVDFMNVSYKLLTSSSYNECREIADSLIGKTRFKQQNIQAVTEEVERRIKEKSDERVIFEGDPAWRLVWAGAVASIIASKYKKPTFIYRKGDSESCGSVRSLVDGENSVEAMKSCSEILTTYGGHAKASGFRLKNENLEKFKVCLEEYFVKNKK